MSQDYQNAKMRISDIRANLNSTKTPNSQKNISIKPLMAEENEETNNLQYVNEFYRTQIGHYVKVDCYIGFCEVISKYGFLTTVGSDYIILQDAITQNITSIDFWSIKFMHVYYDIEKIEKVMHIV